MRRHTQSSTTTVVSVLTRPAFCLVHLASTARDRTGLPYNKITSCPHRGVIVGSTYVPCDSSRAMRANSPSHHTAVKWCPHRQFWIVRQPQSKVGAFRKQLDTTTTPVAAFSEYARSHGGRGASIDSQKKGSVRTGNRTPRQTHPSWVVDAWNVSMMRYIVRGARSVMCASHTCRTPPKSRCFIFSLSGDVLWSPGQDGTVVSAVKHYY